MTARYFVVDVFAREPLAGNALAVFPEPGSVAPDRMQRIAREMNLSETTFVTAARDDGYDVRIFTPTEELPFAGHPTLGTSWVLRHLGIVKGDRVAQRSAAGETPVTFAEGRVWLQRTGSVGADLDVRLALDALGLGVESVGFDATAIGSASQALRPAMADAGVPQLMLPLVDASTVASLRAPASLGEVDGVYCFAPLGKGRIKARFFAPGFGVSEDPATGSAAAALGLYLGARIGEISVEIEQGVEIARPSFISLEASPGVARVGGEVHLVAEARLRA
jgi:trans-2,3-dihydro-3-hydroxyanthranilate isomerase